MASKIRILIGLALITAVGSMLSSCGGGGTTAAPHFTDPGNYPGAGGHIGNGGGAGLPGSGNGSSAPPLARLVDPQPIVGASPNAPLGTNPAYDVHEVTPQTSAPMGVSSLLSSLAAGKGASSVVIPGGEAIVNDVTVASVGATPDWSASPETLVFNEGQTVTLWAEYEVTPSTTVDRSFDIPQTQIHYTDQVVSTAGGTVIVDFDYTLPYLHGGGNTPAAFEFHAAAVSGGASSGSIGFTIIDVPTIQLPLKSWQMAWETQLTQADYDYNDLVARMTAQETLNTDTNKIVQIDVVVKALARGEGYSADWEFNLENSFPGAESVTSTTQLYKAGGTILDGPLRTWSSTMGVCIPVFTPVRNVLPSPPGGGSVVNTQLNQEWRAGGLAKIRIFPMPPMEPNTYQPLPWTNQMLILSQNDSDVYVISLSTNRGGNVVAGDPHPLGFILPADAPAYSWPLEGRNIDLGYPRFDQWVTWWNSNDTAPEPKWWEDAPVPLSGDLYNVYSRTSVLAGPSNIAGGPSLPIPN